MRRMLMVAAMLAGAAAFAQGEGHGEAAHGEAAHGEAAHGEGAGEKHDVAGYILHHVTDSPEYEFEVPLWDQFNKVIHLPTWQIPLRAGACPEDPRTPGSLTAGCLDLSLSKHTVMMWLAAVLLILAFAFGSNRDKSKLVPHGTSQNLLEMLVLFVRDEIAVKNIGKEYGPKYTPYLLTAFFFILFMNLLGLVPWMATATSNVAVTLALATCTFIVTQFASIQAAGLKTWLKHLTGGVAWWLWVIMIPVEVLGLFTKPFALTVRLFANMVAGHIVLFFLIGLIFMLNHPAVALASVPLAMGIYMLELFVCFVQAYVFTMLSALFIGMGVAMAHHSEHDDQDHGHPHVEGGHGHDHGQAHHSS